MCKKGGNFKTNLISTKWACSYIFLALELFDPRCLKTCLKANVPWEHAILPSYSHSTEIYRKLTSGHVFFHEFFPTWLNMARALRASAQKQVEWNNVAMKKERSCVTEIDHNRAEAEHQKKILLASGTNVIALPRLRRYRLQAILHNARKFKSVSRFFHCRFSGKRTTWNSCKLAKWLDIRVSQLLLPMRSFWN